MTKKIIQWGIRGIFLLLSFCGFATIYSYNHGYSQVIDNKTLQCAWVFGVCGVLFFILTFVNFKRGKNKNGI